MPLLSVSYPLCAHMHSTWHHSDELLYSRIFPAGAGLKALTDPINCLWRNPPCNSDEITTSLMPLEARPFIMGWLMEQKAFLLCTCRQNPHPWRPPFLPCPPHIILYWILNYWFLGKKNTSGFKLQWKPAQHNPWRWRSALVYWGTSAEHNTEASSRGGPKALQLQQWGSHTPAYLPWGTWAGGSCWAVPPTWQKKEKKSILRQAVGLQSLHGSAQPVCGLIPPQCVGLLCGELHGTTPPQQWLIADGPEVCFTGSTKIKTISSWSQDKEEDEVV